MNTNSLRTILAKALGGFWLLDGLLQFQPKMFGSAFVTDVLAPTLQGQPGVVQDLIHFGITLWNTNTILTDIAAGLLQCSIGVLLFFPGKSTGLKIGLWISIVWGLIVWVFGEGFGSLFTGTASFYTGAPGAVLAYVVLSVGILGADRFGARAYARFVGWTFIVFSLMQLQPTFWMSDGIRSLFTGSSDALGFISAVPRYLGNLAAIQPIGANLLLFLALLVIGALLVWKPQRITGVVALMFLFIVWWVGQDFGQLTTLIMGISTDPDTAPLLALFVLPLFIPMNMFCQVKGGTHNEVASVV